jgi:hypothetical protein
MLENAQPQRVDFTPEALRRTVGGRAGCLVSFQPLRYSCADEGPVGVEVTI